VIAQCYKDRLEIATHAGVVTEALQQVEKNEAADIGTDITKAQSDNRLSQ
jgi:hypothetical protein